MQSYEIIVIDGDLQQYIEDPCIESLCYNSVSWEEAVSLCRLATDQGFRCIVRRETGDGGADNETAGFHDLC